MSVLSDSAPIGLPCLSVSVMRLTKVFLEYWQVMPLNVSPPARVIL